MEAVIEDMIEKYLELKQIHDSLDCTQRVYNAKKIRDMWAIIREERKDSPRAKRMKIFRDAHPEKVYEQYLKHRAKHRELKQEVLSYYGGGQCACVHCGEKRIACLSIDHIDGGGSKHRKKVLRSTSSFYTWLKRENYPEGYQTLCMNCQFVKRFTNEEHR